MSTIKLDLGIDEVNLILEAVGQLPFARVYKLVGRIQEQVQEQLQTSEPAQQQEDGEA